MVLLSLFDFCHSDENLIRKGLITNRDLIIAQLDTEEPDQIDVLCVGTHTIKGTAAKGVGDLVSEDWS